MKISGFTFVRNAIKYDYPARESILSILPFCDEVVVAVGNSSDETLDLIKSIASPKIKIIETVWDDDLRTGGRTLALETNKAFAAIDPSSDWAFYIQADEIVHEQYHPIILEAMEKWKNVPAVEGLLLNYLHFYGSYDFVGQSSRWYRREIRVIRNRKDIFSFRDAQGFRKKPNEKLKVKPIKASMYHYGWVKDPRAMQNKLQTFHKLWHDDAWVEENVSKAEEFDYKGIDALSVFDETHPAVMRDWIKRKNWKFDHDVSCNKFTKKEIIRRWIEEKTGWRIGEYRNYRLI
jgi:glycosyltransferase involved in cell wall biosynthesis